MNILSILMFFSGVASVISLAGLGNRPLWDFGLLGPIIFVATLAWTLRTAAMRLERLEDFQRRLDEEIKEFSRAERHGHAIQDLAALTAAEDHAGTVRALSKTFLNIATKIIPASVQSLQGYKAGRELPISENYIVGSVLKQLPANLPDGCVWLGISKLVAGWDEAADPFFAEFANEIERLASEKRLSIFRVYCVRPSERAHVDRIVGMLPSVGVFPRIFETDDAGIPDMSVILKLERPNDLQKQTDPVHFACTVGEPLYAMEFAVIGGVLLQTVQFVTPASARFHNLVNVFKQTWRRATVP